MSKISYENMTTAGAMLLLFKIANQNNDDVVILGISKDGSSTTFRIEPGKGILRFEDSFMEGLKKE